jgi:hypothetical protein
LEDLKMRRNVLVVASLVSLTAYALASSAPVPPVMDGEADDPLYGGAALFRTDGQQAIQDTQTGYGDASLGRFGPCNGSEIDVAYGVVYDDGSQEYLFLVLAGNFETNGNKLSLFFDTRAGGQNRLLFDNPGPDPNAGIRRMSESAPGAGDGLTFFTGFAADFWLSVGCFGDPVGVFVDYAELYVDAANPGDTYYVGEGDDRCNTVGGAIDTSGGGNNPFDILVTVDNSNIDGVTGGFSPEPFGGLDVTTGIELSIPLAAIGDPVGDIIVTAFIGNPSYDGVSNQLMGGMLGFIGDNLGDPRLLDLNATVSHRPFIVPRTPVALGACCVGTTCSIKEPAACTGTYLGDNVSCEGNPCASAVGACCFGDGTCDVRSETDCLGAGGIYQGDDTLCVCCPQLGACCDGNTCMEMLEADCLGMGFDFVGEYTLCADGPCAAGACCVGTACTDVRRFECTGDRFFEGVTCASNPCLEPTITTPHVAGSMQGWDPTSSPMTETAPGSSVWELEFTGLTPDTRYEYKITNGLDWADPNHQNLPGANSWCFTDANGTIKIFYDGNFYADGWFPERDRLPLPAYSDPGTWTAAGSFQGWNNADPATAMLPQGGGVYMYEGTGLAADTYEWKAVITGSWDSISVDGRSIFTANMPFVINDPSDIFRLYVDPLNCRVKVEIVSGQVWCLGDANCSTGSPDFGDIEYFVAALSGETSWSNYHVGQTGNPPACPYLVNDMNGYLPGGTPGVEFSDIPEFVAQIGQACIPNPY